MGIFAVFNSEGFVRGLYHVDTASKAPAGAVPIDEATWADLAEYQGLRRWDGAKVVSVPPPTPPSAAVRTAKADIWRRCTDDEGATLDGLLKARPARLQRLWTDSAYLDHADAEYANVLAAVTAALGAARAAVILAPSV